MAEGRSYGQSSYTINLGETPTIVQKIEGGTPVADIVEFGGGDLRMMKKTVGGLKYENIKFDLGISMGGDMLAWVNAFLDNKHDRKQGFVTYGDFDKKARAYTDFRDALLTSFALPACDAASKDSGKLSIEMAVEQTVARKGDSAPLKGTLNPDQKFFLANNFRLSIADLPCKRVTKIDPITFSCTVVEDQTGEARIHPKEPSNTKISNLKVTFSAADEDPWQQWFDDFCIKGNNGEGKELSGSLEWMNPSTQKPVASLEMQNIGIFKLSSDAASSTGDAIRRMTAEMYLENARFKIG